MALWLVRAGGRGECEGHALDHNKILIGWDDMSDISDVNDRDQLFSLVNETYPDQTQHTLRNWNGQLWAFKSRIKRDDLVVLPLKSRSAIAIGKVVGDYEYDNSVAGGHHQRKVEWIESDLPRSRFDQDHCCPINFHENTSSV